MKKAVLTILFVLAVSGAVVVLLAEHGYSITAMLQPPEIRDFEVILARGRPAEDSRQRELARQFAGRFKARYEDMKFLSFDAEVYEIPAYMTATAKVTMRPGFYTTKAWFDGRLVWKLMFKDGKAYEHKLPYRGVVDQTLTYPVERPDGPGSISLSDGIPFHMGCMIGGYLSTWVGPDCSHISLLIRRLEEGWYVRKENVDGFPCLIFFYPLERVNRVEKYYIDEASFLLRRYMSYDWVSTSWFDKKTMVRVRTYHNMVAKGEKKEGY